MAGYLIVEPREGGRAADAGSGAREARHASR
jgi:hypothetical protein